MNDKLKTFEFNMVGRTVECVEVNAVNSKEAYKLALKTIDRRTFKGRYIDWDEEDTTLTTVDGQYPYDYCIENDDYEFVFTT